MPSLEASVTIRCPVEKAFDFLTQTENLFQIIPDELKLRVVSAPPQLQLGFLGSKCKSWPSDRRRMSLTK